MEFRCTLVGHILCSPRHIYQIPGRTEANEDQVQVERRGDPILGEQESDHFGRVYHMPAASVVSDALLEIECLQLHRRHIHQDRLQRRHGHRLDDSSRIDQQLRHRHDRGQLEQN